MSHMLNTVSELEENGKIRTVRKCCNCDYQETREHSPIGESGMIARRIDRNGDDGVCNADSR